MEWFWFIPAFHMSTRGSATESTTYKLTRKEIDFPLGVGSYLVDVEVGMEWCDNETSEVSTPPDTPLDSRGQDSPVDEAQGAVAKESEQVADL